MATDTIDIDASVIARKIAQETGLDADALAELDDDDLATLFRSSVSGDLDAEATANALGIGAPAADEFGTGTIDPRDPDIDSGTSLADLTRDAYDADAGDPTSNADEHREEGDYSAEDFGTGVIGE